MKKSDFNYELPEELIAQTPLPERSASRLLVLEKRSSQLTDRHVCDLVELAGPDDLFVFNDTRVIPARLFGEKATGGKVEILIERITGDKRAVVHLRGSKPPKPGAKIRLDGNYFCRVEDRLDDLFLVEFLTDVPIGDLLREIGHIPLPPYIARADNTEDAMRYQSVFAQHDGAVAAPTASLHFDLPLMAKLEAKGVNKAFVTLHVGSGTFQPVRAEDLTQHQMHKEYYCVPDDTVAAVNKTREAGGKVIAIGTTALRALESASRMGTLQAGFGDTDLFITPGYQFKSVDALLTNFHLPESTLIMLVAAFAGYQPVMTAYRHAVEKRYRFFSYGDAMFIG